MRAVTAVWPRFLTFAVFALAIYWVAVVWDGRIPEWALPRRSAAFDLSGPPVAAGPQLPAIVTAPASTAQALLPTEAPATPVPATPALAPAPTTTAVQNLPAPTQMPTPGPPTSAQVWTALQPELDAAWGTDTARTVVLLDTFLTRFPEHEAAREKLYAALLARANDLIGADEPERAVEDLMRADTVLPGRSDALATLAMLTPTPAQTDPETVVEAPAPVAPRTLTGASAGVVARPAVPARPAGAVQQPAPTPTKVPFVVPSRAAP